VSEPPRVKVNLGLLIGGLVFTAALVALLAVGFTLNPRAVPSVMEDKEAPNFTLTSLEGETVSLSAFAGRPVVLNFWSTWCGPCKQEHPVLLQAASMYPEVVFLGVLYQDDPDLARRYLQRAGAAYTHLLDPGNRTAIDYGVTGVPESFFIDRSGTVVRKVAVPLHPEMLYPQLQALLETQ